MEVAKRAQVEQHLEVLQTLPPLGVDVEGRED